MRQGSFGRKPGSLKPMLDLGGPIKKALSDGLVRALSSLALMAGLIMGGSALAQDAVGNAAAAADKISMCTGCHSIPGYKSSFPVVYPVPMIAGQSEKYLVSALKAYRKGDRSHPSMTAVAASLTDQDIADVAAYFAKLN